MEAVSYTYGDVVYIYIYFKLEPSMSINHHFTYVTPTWP
jgi:hypothetical protein